MSLLRRLALASGAWLLAQGACADALDTLDQCAARASADAAGLAALEAQCPGVGAALAELGVTTALPPGWQERLGAAGVQDLARLVHHYRDPPVAAPDTAALSSVLAQLAREQVVPTNRSWWSALMDKLRSWFSQQQSGSMPWLDRLLERMAASVDFMQVLAYVLLALVVAVLGYYAVRELRASGVLQRRRREGGVGASAVHAGVAPAAPDLDAVALHEQPALLLQMLVAQLRARGQLQRERSLTHAELLVNATFSDGDSRGRFERVTRLAERVLYGPGRPDPAQVVEVVGDGRALLRQLRGADQ